MLFGFFQCVNELPDNPGWVCVMRVGSRQTAHCFYYLLFYFISFLCAGFCERTCRVLCKERPCGTHVHAGACKLRTMDGDKCDGKAKKQDQTFPIEMRLNHFTDFSAASPAQGMTIK